MLSYDPELPYRAVSIRFAPNFSLIHRQEILSHTFIDAFSLRQRTWEVTQAKSQMKTTQQLLIQPGCGQHTRMWSSLLNLQGLVIFFCMSIRKKSIFSINIWSVLMFPSPKTYYHRHWVLGQPWQLACYCYVIYTFSQARLIQKE